ncbi:hypothetical protein AAG604_11130 [Citromicrobium bathyomarinum]
MVKIVHLDFDAERPSLGDDERWLFVEQSEEGLFYGSGGSWKPSGEWVGYGSLAENDTDLDRAITAARKWADRYDVPTIWVFASNCD